MIRLMICCLLLTACSIAQEKYISSAEKDILIKNVTIVPMDTERIVPGQDVFVSKGKIVSVGNTGKIKTGDNIFIVDGTGKFLMPGLAEMHAHVPPENDMTAIEQTGFLFALKGITTIRGMLGHPLHLEYRKKVTSGEIVGPRFITSGPSFSGNTIKSTGDAVALVKAQKAAGYDFLKLHPGLTPETFAAMATTAKEVGIPFAGHVSYKVGVWSAIEAGYATIDHMDGFVESLVPGIQNIPESDAGIFAVFIGDKADENQIPKLISALKAKGIWVVPTECLPRRWFAAGDPAVLNAAPEMIYMKPETRNNWMNAKTNFQKNPKYNPAAIEKLIQIRQKILLECQKNGVGILLGSDAPQVFDVPGFSAHQELEYYVDAGLTPYQALVTGTVNVGRYLSRKDIGTVKNGSVADLILINANPLKDIKATRDIEGVMLAGKWMSKNYISQELKKLERK